MLPRPDRQRRSRLNNFRFAVPALMTGLAVLFSTGVAHALEEFPAEIQELLALDCTPACVLCHTTPAGGQGTATQPFVGVVGLTAILNDRGAALAAAEQNPEADGDGDGINDVAEIRANTNPNVKDLPDKPSDPICSAAQYGCGARIAPADESAPANRSWGILAALGVAVWLSRRRRAS